MKLNISYGYYKSKNLLLTLDVQIKSCFSPFSSLRYDAFLTEEWIKTSLEIIHNL